MLKLKMGLTGLKPVDLAERANTLVTKVTGNANFPTPTPDVALITTKKEELQTLIAEASRGDRDKIAARKVAYAELHALLKQLASYVSYTAGGNELMILSSGFGVVKPVNDLIQVREPVLFPPEQSRKSGQLKLKWERIDGARSYVVEKAETDPSQPDTVWSHLAISVRRQITISGLVPGKYYWFRVQAVGSHNVSAFSDVALAMVL